MRKLIKRYLMQLDKDERELEMLVVSIILGVIVGLSLGLILPIP